MSLRDWGVPFIKSNNTAANGFERKGIEMVSSPLDLTTCEMMAAHPDGDAQPTSGYIDTGDG